MYDVYADPSCFDLLSSNATFTLGISLTYPIGVV